MSKIKDEKWILTPATVVTIFRICLLPVFIWLAVRYSATLQAGEPDRALRTWAVGIFVFAALTDGIDGFMARHFNQKSHLGATLDPLADKLFLGVSIIAFCLAPWEMEIPLWFAVFVIARDVIQLVSLAVLHSMIGKVKMVAFWTGKAGTLAQMVALCWIMVQLPWMGLQVILWLGAVFIWVSGFQYLLSAVSQHAEFQRNRNQPGSA